MYLTRFRVNTARTGARRLFGSPHHVHGAVNMAFPELPTRDGEGPRVLWRVDHHTGTGRTDLFIVSPRRPDLTHLVEQAGWPTLPEQGWTTFSYGEFLGALAVGDTWNFRLTANPVHSIRKPGDAPGARNKLAAHVTRRHQLGWLLQRQERGGFEVVQKPADRRLLATGDEHEVIVYDRTPVQFGKRSAGALGAAAVGGTGGTGGSSGKGRDVTFTQVTYDGRLRITDLAAFRRTLTHGLGKAKAYGCGLMTIAPAR
ncbi:type I-E CRISPR-associated protein Cas6/Cse3/CasE [Streptomyces sp. CBMA152]|uniref:type I-E CRISPR-associated protein Cas6/Cse3/CasE n=1 Tax=Streptomyces sp. CBMA152 TaxID=1896312 RepID=UPI0016600E84|nr:type I-E CRISPR-associated protein Cas6/Cse3/CasE [Streptomyces sp. CBMA152]MBD0746008.1 type I-E CRISPR-associated protein Cas6/Cse3/CasE [Streptomyces sp. CBMA152]